MHECDEVAAAMLLNYINWLWHQCYAMSTMDRARAYVRMQTGDDSVTVVDNVAESLHRRAGDKS